MVTKSRLRLVDHYHASLRRVARLYISNRAVADEVVQDTWLGVIQGMWAFVGRSSLKTWIFRILIKSVGGINALHPRSPPRAPLPLPSTPTSARWIPAGAVGTAHMTSLRAPATPPRLSGMLRWHTSAVNRHWEHVARAHFRGRHIDESLTSLTPSYCRAGSTAEQKT